MTHVGFHTILAITCTMQPFHPVVSPTPGAIAGWMSANNPSLQHPAVAAGPPTHMQPSSAGEAINTHVVCGAHTFF